MAPTLSKRSRYKVPCIWKGGIAMSLYICAFLFLQSASVTYNRSNSGIMNVNALIPSCCFHKLSFANPRINMVLNDDSEGVNGNRNNFISGYSSDGYSSSLKRDKRSTFNDNTKVDDDDEDGYEMMGKKKRRLWKKLLIAPIKLSKKILTRKDVEPGTLILVRHGESQWNANKTFTGWADPDLSDMGHREVEHAARLLLEGGYTIDVVFTSRLTRAIRSTWILLQELNEVHIPVFKSWRLNERMYGALTGLSKKETAEKLGAELVQQWRGSLRTRPPPLQVTDEYWPGRDRRHFDLTNDQIPLTESLLDCMERSGSIWENRIGKKLRAGENVLVVAHANTLRGLVRIIDDIHDDNIQEIAFPRGVPVVYKFDSKMKPIQPSGGSQTAAQMHMSGLFLEKPGLLKEALKREEEWKNHVQGYNSTMKKSDNPITPLEQALIKLKAERELEQWADQFSSEPNVNNTSDKVDGEDDVWEKGIQDLKEGQPFSYSTKFKTVSDNPLSETADILDEKENVNPTIVTNNPVMTSIPAAAMVKGIGEVPIRKDAVIVIIRHGKTENNKLGLFTGWEDVPLAKEGVEEAKTAGQLLKLHGFEFDVVYTSWLRRAVETAWNVIDELDCLWLPIVKSWRLNERMYGDLTGLSKRMVAQRHGDEQFKAWRRGFNVRPPKVSSFSPNYPGNDSRYKKYLRDVRFSVSESLIRSIEGRKLQLERKLPKTESLKDCMDRTIPYFAHQIVPEAVNQGKRVLISSSENAIRGLLMHLCEIPEEHVTELEIPNGIPLIFDVKSKCVKLLDDGTGRDPLEVYNFGKAANYLFSPRENEDGSPVDKCEIRYMSDDR